MTTPPPLASPAHVCTVCRIPEHCAAAHTCSAASNLLALYRDVPAGDLTAFDRLAIAMAESQIWVMAG